MTPLTPTRRCPKTVAPLVPTWQRFQARNYIPIEQAPVKSFPDQPDCWAEGAAQITAQMDATTENALFGGRI